MSSDSLPVEPVARQHLAQTPALPADLQERARTLLQRASDAATEQFRAAVRPIYGVGASSRPDQLGSSVLIEIDGIRSIVTAAHVIDDNRTMSLYVGGNDSLLPLVAEFGATIAPKDDRRMDHYDFAVAELPITMLDGMEDLKFITPNEIAPRELVGDGTYLTAIGFPNSKNKPPKNNALKVRGQSYAYSDINRPSASLAGALGVTGDEHLFIRHGKHSRDEAGNKASTIGPRGLSGGAIIYSGDFTDREMLLGRVQPVPRLVGITIELHTAHHVLLGTRIHAILDAVRATRGTQADGGQAEAVPKARDY